ATTLFAPGVTKESGWYDTNKAFTTEDSQLCWAATATNVITWWMDNYERGGGDLSGISARNTQQVFQNFQTNFHNVGYDNGAGVNWYFTGKFSSGTEPEELQVSNSGGYLSKLEGVGGRNAWSLINGDFKYTGVAETGRIFLNNMTGSYYPNEPLYSHKSFSESILNQLAFGVSMLSVHKLNGNSHSGHSITLWGCDYDETTKLVTKIYVTDSDDRRNELREYTISVPTNGKTGVIMDNYWYDSTLYGPITDSVMLYSPYIIPEPSAFGLLAGMVALAFVASRRRKRN
ncbi:MAG: IdeS/Mac family cysteine endopeptidase, partial [Opitutales bacterium]|nr:IdeS/Mac family cysteine endopeptidase [Opitutales bacterium]